FGTGGDIQRDGAVQHPRDLDRVADMGRLVANRTGPAISGDDDPAPFAQGPFGGGAEMSQVTRDVRPDRGGHVATLLVRSQKDDAAADAVDLRAKDRQPPDTEFRLVACGRKACPGGGLGARTFFDRQGEDGCGAGHLGVCNDLLEQRRGEPATGSLTVEPWRPRTPCYPVLLVPVRLTPIRRCQ